MENYKRLVSYVYNYENGIKGNNVGYAKIEIRNTQCKITIHIRVLSLSEKQLNAYIFHRENGVINCLLLGAATIKNGACECKVVTNTDNILGSGYSFDEMGGIVLYVSTEKFFGTEWDDNPIDLKMVDVTKNKTKEQQPEQEINRKSDVEAAQMVNSGILKAVMDAMKDKREEDKKEDEIKVADEHKEEKQETVDQEAVSEVKEIVINEMERKKAEVNEKELSNTDQIFLKYPKMYPFEDDEILDCIRIEPQDIGIFPMENWVYANNSFLLHSYYSYRHLIFAKKKLNNQVEYILGVPGVYHNREQFMARMFGFPNFKPIKNCEQKPGEFGYWYFNMML